jgi:hypothetical protein
MVSVTYVWSARGRGAAAKLQRQTEVADNLMREQTDKVRIPRQARVVIGKNLLRSRRSADVIIFFQQQHA